jgi:hypothetical protein
MGAWLTALKETQAVWSPLVLILVVRDAPVSWWGDVRHIRAFTIDKQSALTDKYLVTTGKRIQSVFGRLKARWTDKTIMKVQDALLGLVDSGVTLADHAPVDPQ